MKRSMASDHQRIAHRARRFAEALSVACRGAQDLRARDHVVEAKRKARKKPSRGKHGMVESSARNSQAKRQQAHRRDRRRRSA